MSRKVLSIGIVGTAKNTGKTTTLSAILQAGTKNESPIALTSIGYDGEAVDNLTLLPKPRVEVTKNQIIATAAKCVEWAQADVEIIKKTDIETGLGNVYIVRVTKPGKIMLAGPNKHQPLKHLINILSEYTDKIIVDGALGRIAPFSIVDSIIFATGAARFTKIDLLAEEMSAIHSIFSLPGIKKAGDYEDYLSNGKISMIAADKEIETLPVSSLLSVNDAEILAGKIKSGKFKKVIIPGAISSNPIKSLLEKTSDHLQGMEIVFSSAPAILSGWEPILLNNIVSSFRDKGAGISLVRKQEIIAITVNPFYPHRMHRGARYTEAFVDAEELLKQFKSRFSLPVIDIMKEGPERISGITEGYFGR